MFQLCGFSPRFVAVPVTRYQARVIQLSSTNKCLHVFSRLHEPFEKVKLMTDMTQNPKPDWTKRLPLIVILCVAAVGAVTLGDYISFDALRDNREALIGFRDEHALLTVVVFVAAYVAIVAFSLPGALAVTLTGGFLFGTVAGSLLSVVGATIGATLIFLAVRVGFGAHMEARLSASPGKVGQIKKGLEENQWSMLFVMRLVPVVPFFVANLVPAFLSVQLYRYVVSTFIGIIPGSLVYSSVGAGLGEVFAKGESPDLGVIFEWYVLLPILGLCVLSLLPVFIKAATGKKVS